MSLTRILANIGTALDSATTGDFLSKVDSDGVFGSVAYSSVTGTPTVLDSANVTNLVDSAYVQLRQSAVSGGGLDSATTISLVDSDYITSRATASGFQMFEYNATAGQTDFTGSDVNGNTLAYSEYGLLVHYNGILLSAATDYTATDGTTVVLTDSADEGARITIAKWSLASAGGGAGAASAVSGSAKTSFLLKTDSTQTDAQVDASTNALTITQTGNVTSTAFTPYHPKGYNISFNNSTNDELITATDNSFVIGTNDFTAEVWVYLTETLGSYNKVMWSGTGSSMFSIETQSTDNKLHVTDYHSTIFGTSSTALSVGVWTHVAVVRSSGTMKMYFDGTEVMSISNSTNFVGTDVRLARNDTTIILRDARLVVGTAVYTAAFTPPTEPLTAIANTKFLGANLPYLAYEDASGAGNAYGTIGGSPDIVPTTSPYDYVAYSPSSHGGSVYFDGTGDYLTTSSNIHNGIGTGDFTAEAWVYLDEAIGSNRGIFGSGSSDVADEFTLLLLTNGSLYFDYGGSQDYVQTGAVFTANTWHHIALTRSGTSFNIWLNGTSVASTTLSANIGGSSNFAVGWGRGIVWKGYISDARVVTGTAVYTAAFTPPTSPLTAISGTQLLTCTNKNNIFDAAGGNLLTVVGDTTTNTSTVNYSSSSVYFDGGGDYIKLDGSFSDFFDNPFTIEFFVNLTSASSSSVISLGDGSGVDGLYLLHGGYGCYVGTNGSWNLISGSVTGMTTGTWHHFAFTWDGSVYRIFVDGSLELTSTNSTKIGPGGGYTLAIGATYTGVQPTNGYVEDVRFTKGLARYTSAFTPPSAALEG